MQDELYEGFRLEEDEDDMGAPDNRPTGEGDDEEEDEDEEVEGADEEEVI